MTNKLLQKSEFWLVFNQDKLVIAINSPLQPIKHDQIHVILPHLTRQHHLAEFEEMTIRVAEIHDASVIPPEFSIISLRNALLTFDEHWYSVLTKSFSIINWDRNHQFCGRCGCQTVQTSEHFERHCAHCELNFYPRISPSIIVLIKKGDELLMARSPHFPPGAYALIAGFVNAGEDIESAVHREVKEEVNVRIKNLTYMGSQSWPFPDSLMIAFFADYDDGELIINPTEIEAAGWYRYDQLPGRPTASVSIGSKLIDQFIREQEAAATKSKG